MLISQKIGLQKAKQSAKARIPTSPKTIKYLLKNHENITFAEQIDES